MDQSFARPRLGSAFEDRIAEPDQRLVGLQLFGALKE
jgi:hypothetical protein